MTSCNGSNTTTTTIRAKSSYFSNASSYRENVASARRVVKYWTFFIAVPCRCGLRGGYIELVGFNDQLRSRVKTYLSAKVALHNRTGTNNVCHVVKWERGP